MTQVAWLIAVVDDDESVRKAFGRLLSASGFDVQQHSSGPEFLRSIRHQRPHCVVLDIRMPSMNGFDVQQALCKIDGRLPVVVISADDSAECRARAVQLGARAYLCKPIDDAMLLDAIHIALEAPSPPGP